MSRVIVLIVGVGLFSGCDSSNPMEIVDLGGGSSTAPLPPSADEVAEELKADEEFLLLVHGPLGQQGDDGKQGEPGPKGERGAQGEQGSPGSKGDKGDPGEDGLDGIDIDDPALVADELQSRADFLASVKGEPGDQGPPGDGGGLWSASGADAYYDSGNVGIATASPTEKLSVAGIIESTTGGFRFPDGTLQTSAGTGGTGGITGVTAGSGLSGGGTSGNVTVDVASGGIDASHLAGAAVTMSKISAAGANDGQVIKRVGNSVAWANDLTGGGSSDHGQMAGLADDDHPQYMPVTRSGDQYIIGQHKLVLQALSNGPSIQIDKSTGGSPATIRYRDNADLVIDGRSFVTLSANGSVDIYDYNSSTWGQINAAEFSVVSSRELKRDIQILDGDDCQYWLDSVSGLEPATYVLISESDRHPDHGARRRFGLIAEDVPPELQSTLLRTGTKGIDVYALATALVASVKGLNTLVADQALVIDELAARLAVLERKSAGQGESSWTKE